MLAAYLKVLGTWISLGAWYRGDEKRKHRGNYTDSVVNPSINYPKYHPKWVL